MMQKQSRNKGMTFIPRSFSQRTVNENPEKLEKNLEKEFESIGEESSVQFIQNSMGKRDKSLECFQGFKRIATVSRDELNQLELDLSSSRKQYLFILEEKLKIEKEVIAYKARIKLLEEKSVQDSNKLYSFENLVKKSEILEKKIVEISEKLKDSTSQVKKLLENNESLRVDAERMAEEYEEKLVLLSQESAVLKQEQQYKDQYIEKLLEEIESLKKDFKEKSDNQAVKTLSSIILSKDKPSENSLKIRNLQKELESLKENHDLAQRKNKELREFIDFLTGFIKSEDYSKVGVLVNECDFGSSLNISKSSWNSGKKMENEQEKLNFELQGKIETLEMKLDVVKNSKDFIAFLQCQASVIEDYLNEDAEVSQINSSLFSI